MPPMHDMLAPELISMILSLLHREDLLHTSLVSRSFRVLSARFLYTALVFRGPPAYAIDVDDENNLVESVGEQRRARIEQLLTAFTPVGESTQLGTPGRNDATYWQSDVEPSAWIRSIQIVDYFKLSRQWLDLARLVKTATTLKHVIMKTNYESRTDNDDLLLDNWYDSEIYRFWTELQRSESLNALTLILGPSIPLGLDQFRNLTHLSIKSYSIDGVEDGVLPLTLTHLSLEYVHDIDDSFFHPALLANLCSLSLKNIPREAWVIITKAIKSFASQTPRPTSSLRKLVMDPFPHGFACLTVHTWIPTLSHLFLTLSSPTYSALVDLAILSTSSSSREYILDARTLLQVLGHVLPHLEGLIYTVGAGDVFIDAYDGTASHTSSAMTFHADHTLWLASFAEFKALRSLTHNLLLPNPGAIRVACRETFTRMPTLNTFSIRTGTKKAFDFSRMVPNEDGTPEEGTSEFKVRTVLYYGSLGMTEVEARRRWPEAKLGW
ncbi:BQ5605_C033g11168 [Microbotryum silenes-dioicae]|uniref:BQ5605_C033g11168 protein n=1 Tax=Microbotryum silenes-dioicae TaxID=796604 RepID=A0A2X0PBC2_9BASI|nr:BQ5605_C033g11168 [Microbotryum silenes-dioicae]